MKPRVRALAAVCLSCFLAASAAAADETPLNALPYTPSLDPTAMDRSVDPCVDFYAYACGGWIAHNPIPEDQSSWDVYGKLYHDNQRFLWGILDELSRTTQPRTPSQQKIGDYFAACMDEEAIEARGLKPLEPGLARIEAIGNRRELARWLADVQMKSGSGQFLFGFGSNQDYADSEQVIAFVVAGGLGLPDRDYYTDTDEHARKLREQYQTHVANVLGLVGESAPVASRDAATVLRLGTRLAEVQLTRVELRDPNKQLHKLSVAELKHLAPGFPWADYLDALGLGQVAILNVTEPKAIARMARLVADTPLPELKAYLRWHLANVASADLSRALDAERFAFNEHVLRGVPVEKPRWRRCVAWTDALLGDALGQEYVARAFGPELRAKTSLMVTQIEQAMREDIESLTWMSEPTKRQALEKLAVIVNKIGYPEHWRDYSAVEIVRGDFFGDTQRATEFESRRQLAKIGKPLDRSEWTMTPPTVNAYFDPQMNDINFPAAVLQPPLYDARLDDAPNYGNTGGTIGHELTHAFDDEGRQFDSHGNLRDWWSAEDAHRFKERAQCLIDQNSRYIVVDDLHSNGALTQGEDIADLGGMILAHMAWKVQTAAQSLPDRDGLTPEQRFFVGYAQWACSGVRPEEERLRVKTDPHSTLKLRINGTVVDYPEFQQAFSCKAGQPMVAEKACRIW